MKRALVALTAVLFIISGIALVRSRRDTRLRSPVIAAASTTPVRPPAARVDGPEAVRRRLDAIRKIIAANPSVVTAPDPDWESPFSQVEASLRARAAAGDMGAATKLGLRAASCQQALREKSRADVVEEWQQERTEATAVPANAEIRRRNVDSRFQRQLAHYDDCAALGQARTEDFLLWLERAGRAGGASAQLAFAQHAFDEWTTPESMVLDVEEAARRRAVARSWIEAQVEQGKEQALNVYTEALSGSRPLYVRDAERMQTYQYVLDLVRSRRMGEFERIWAEGPRRYGTELTPSQWRRVGEDGRRIFLRSFKNAPLFPG